MNITVIGWFNLSGFFLLRIFCFFRDAFFFSIGKLGIGN
jgi:hypothetical protein